MINRYSREVIQKIWSDENKYKVWLDIEILVAEAWSRIGRIPTNDVEIIKSNARVDLNRIREIEKETHHDVVAFTRAVSETLGQERKWIHYGLTSSDVVDTANAVLIKQSNNVLRADLQHLLGVLQNSALKYKNVAMIGRTHGVHAEPTTFGYKMALWYSEIKRHIDRFENTSRSIESGKISGAVGTYANIPPSIEEYVCEKLKLNRQEISSQIISREVYADYFAVLALIGSSIAKFATEIRGLQRSEIREVEEFFDENQKGSSAMPHKRNPIKSENLCGLARVLRGNMMAAYENIELWHERDISHSSVERIILPDSIAILDYMLNKFSDTIENLTVFTGRMEKNIYSHTFGLVFSQQLMTSLIDKGLTREEAYDKVQAKTAESWKKQKDFKTLILNDDYIMSILDKQEVDEIFNYRNHFKHIDTVFERIGIKNG